MKIINGVKKGKRYIFKCTCKERFSLPEDCGTEYVFCPYCERKVLITVQKVAQN